MADRAPDDEPPRPTWPHILLIDDDELVRRMAGDLLRQELPQARIHEVGALDGLRQALEAGGFDIALTDYQLGWTDGLVVLREVKNRYPDCPVVMFTATGSEEIAVEAMKTGLDDYVLKSPQHIARLPASIRTVLAQAEARRAARETEARYRTLLDDVLDRTEAGLFILDAACRVVWMNETLERYFGLRRDEALGQDKRRLIRERIKHLFEDPDGFAATVLESYDSGREITFECRLLPGDGREERWLEHRSRLIRSGLYAGGRVEHYYDITERKQAEASARFMHALTEQSHVPLHCVEPVQGFKLVYANAAACRALGYTEAQLLAMRVPDWDPNYPTEACEAQWAKLKQKQVMTFNTTHRRSDGTTLPVEVTLGYAKLGDREYAIGSFLDITERKQMEEALRLQVQQFQNAFDEAPIGMALVSPDGRWLKVNRSLRELTGYSADELLTKTFQDITHPDDLERDLAYVRQMLAGERRTYRMEKRYYHKQGHVVWILLDVSLVSDAQGRPLHFIAQIQDITERKRAEKELHESVAQLGAAQSIAHLGSWDWNIETNQEVWSDEQFRIFGFAPQSFPPTYDTFLNALHPEDRPRVLSAVERSLRGIELYDVECRLILPNGARRFVRCQGEAYRSPDGKPTHMVGTVLDITERKETELRLRETMDKLAAIAQSSPLPIFTLNPSARVSSWNLAAERLFGWTEQELLGKPYPLVPEGKQQEFRAHFEKALRGESFLGVELTRQKKDGTPVHVRLWTTNLLDRAGDITDILTIMEDITERKQMERHAGRIERLAAMGQLFGGMRTS